jgi:anhydro-N-acetylmuramic acid kinase
VQNSSELYLGIMSGTSLDGVDVTLIDLTAAPSIVASHFQPYSPGLVKDLLEMHTSGPDELHRAQLTANQLAGHYADATRTLLQSAAVKAHRVRAIGCHGQTVCHRPEHGYTLQLNNGALLAELSGITVVCDFRARDIAAGGQGAPLVPAFHNHVLRHPTLHRTILNIGGIANLTDLAPNRPTTGFDTGPGNLLMNAWIGKHRGAAYDENGAWAGSGKIIPALLQALLAEPYFATTPPKSTGRDLFNLEWLESHLNGNESPADVQATLLALTADSIVSAIRRDCAGAEEVYVCGGGAHNAALITRLRTALPECRMQKTDVMGIAADWMEAAAFAWLAQQTLHLHPANLPAVTGARHPCILGAIYPA